jgi:hypothetical protein
MNPIPFLIVALTCAVIGGLFLYLTVRLMAADASVFAGTAAIFAALSIALGASMLSEAVQSYMPSQTLQLLPAPVPAPKADHVVPLKRGPRAGSLT